MDAPQDASQLSEYAEEIFALSKTIWAAQTHARAKSQAELTETEFLALDILTKANHTLTVGDLQRQIGVLPAQMSRIIRSLEAKTDQPLVSCQINPIDKRKIDVTLSPAGRQAHEAYRHYKLGTIEAILGGLSPEDRLEFVRILRMIGDRIYKHLQNKDL